MPPPELANLCQYAVLWAVSGIDDYGQRTVAALGVELTVRWESARREMTGPDGEPIAVDATVFVTQAVQIGGNMWLGRLADWTGAGAALSELMKVVAYEEVPDLRNMVSGRYLGLQRFRKRLPGAETTSD